jgi:hypothetical protein
MSQHYLPSPLYSTEYQENRPHVARHLPNLPNPTTHLSLSPVPEPHTPGCPGAFVLAAFALGSTLALPSFHQVLAPVSLPESPPLSSPSPTVSAKSPTSSGYVLPPPHENTALPIVFTCTIPRPRPGAQLVVVSGTGQNWRLTNGLQGHHAWSGKSAGSILGASRVTPALKAQKPRES